MAFILIVGFIGPYFMFWGFFCFLLTFISLMSALFLFFFFYFYPIPFPSVCLFWSFLPLSMVNSCSVTLIYLLCNYYYNGWYFITSTWTFERGNRPNIAQLTPQHDELGPILEAGFSSYVSLLALKSWAILRGVIRMAIQINMCLQSYSEIVLCGSFSHSQVQVLVFQLYAKI